VILVLLLQPLFLAHLFIFRVAFVIQLFVLLFELHQPDIVSDLNLFLQLVFNEIQILIVTIQLSLQLLNRLLHLLIPVFQLAEEEFQAKVEFLEGLAEDDGHPQRFLALKTQHFVVLKLDFLLGCSTTHVHKLLLFLALLKDWLETRLNSTGHQSAARVSENVEQKLTQLGLEIPHLDGHRVHDQPRLLGHNLTPQLKDQPQTTHRHAEDPEVPKLA